MGLGGKCKYFKKSGTAIHDHFRAFLRQLVYQSLIDVDTTESLQYSGQLYLLLSYYGGVRRDHVFLIGDSGGLSTLDLGEGAGPTIESRLLAARSMIGKASYSRSEITKYSSGGLTQRLIRQLLPVRGRADNSAAADSHRHQRRAA